MWKLPHSAQYVAPHQRKIWQQKQWLKLKYLSHKKIKFAFSHSRHNLSWWNFKSYDALNILCWNCICWANTLHGHIHTSPANHQWTQTQTQSLILPKVLLKQARAVEITFLPNTFSASLGKQTLKQEQSLSPPVLFCQYWKLPVFKK